jgi:hypothetical protein
MRKKESAEDFARRFFDQLSFPLFKGTEPYWELFNAGRIAPYQNYVRVTLGGFSHLLYYADEEGNLINISDSNFLAQDPKDVFFQNARPRALPFTV